MQYKRKKMSKEDVLLKEYEEGNKVCMQYESFRRQGAYFFIIVQGAILSILFSDKTDSSLTLKIALSIFGIFVALLTINNDIRVISYYFLYIERLKEIENELGMKLFTVFKPKINNIKFTTKSNYFYRGIAIIVIHFWLLYIVLSILGIEI